jgi:hypothetical protein
VAQLEEVPYVEEVQPEASPLAVVIEQDTEEPREAIEALDLPRSRAVFQDHVPFEEPAS